MKRKIMSALFLLGILLLAVPGNTMAANMAIVEEQEPEAITATAYKHSGSLEMSKLSKAEILNLLENNSLTLPGELFDVAPSYTAPHAPGKVNDTAIQVAVNRLNALRRIAGLPGVAVDSELNVNAQYGAVLLATNGVAFGHYPAKPSGMDDAFYQQAYAATKSSNLYAGVSLAYAVDGFMDDSDADNVSQLGHRRWQLNPTMGKIGFGYAENPNTVYRRYVVEKVFDRSGAGCEYEFISWPASGNFPSQQFKEHEAWSISLNPSKYQKPVKEEIIVTLTRERDGAVWNFYGSNSYTPSGSGEFFNVDTVGYGVNNCIIFRPDGISSYDGVYNVRIQGIKDKSGNAVDFAYRVDFFDESDASETVLAENMFVIDTSPVVYDGTPKTRPINSNLVENVDYVVSYANNINAGTATMYLSGMGNYTGVIAKTFTIEKAARSLAAYASPAVMYVYGLTGNIYISVDNALAESPQYRYQSNNPEAVLVDAAGGLVPKAEGSATITIVADETANYQAGSTTVNVQAKYAAIHKQETNRGKITVSTEKAHVWQRVTFEVKPNEGYWLASVSVTDDNGNPLSLEQNGDGSYTFVVPASDVHIWASFKFIIPEHECFIGHFADVDYHEWYHAALDYVVSEQIMQGTKENGFAPNEKLTRAMLVQMLYSKEGKPEVTSTRFSDVEAGAWYEAAVNWAAEIGIVDGYEDGTFRPERYITRQEMALILYGYAKHKDYDISARGDLNGYQDRVLISNWAYEAMEWANGMGVINGKSATKLDPLANASRAEGAQMFLKLFTMEEDE